MNAPYNFCAGPATLPPEVRTALQADLTDWRGLGRSVLEVSHRTSAYADLQAQTEANLRTLLNLDASWSLLFLQGGASAQFAMLPYNFLRAGSSADYVVQGYWAERAAQQASRVGRVNVLPAPTGWSADAVYAHVTTNETISGIALPEDFPPPPVPLCADMSSDILSAPRDYTRFDLFYAGAQKNLGVAGLAVVVAKKEFLSHARRNLPAVFCYLEHARAGGLYHTPNAFAVDALYHVTRWLLDQGLSTIWARNARKASKLYAVLDASPFWRPLAPREARSHTNVTFRLPTASLEAEFLAQAEQAGLLALKGHRALGGIRASLYNALPEEAVDALTAFMADFEKAHA